MSRVSSGARMYILRCALSRDDLGHEDVPSFGFPHDQNHLTRMWIHTAFFMENSDTDIENVPASEKKNISSQLKV